MVGEAVKGFRFDPGGIGAIFKSYRLRVPTFQREYAWTKDEVVQLFNDLNRAKTEHTDHFLGTIVTISKGAHDPLEIVDGQQRLTTTALLILAIREMQAQLGQPPEVIQSINNDYLGSFDRKRGGTVPKLTLNIDDNDFFAGLVSGVVLPTARESHERLEAAYGEARKFVRTLIKPFNEQDKPGVLNDWLDFVEHGASVILVRTDNAAKAFKMFETLNDRGLKTSQADLVKSYLFGEAGDRIGEAQSRWSSMKDNLEEIADDDRAINYLRHALIATHKFVRADEIYETVQSSIRGESNASRFISSLESLSRVYVATFQPSAEFWTGHSAATARALAVFNRFNVKPIRPLVLAAANAFSPPEFEKAIQLLASLSVRLVLAGRTRTGTIETTFGEAAVGVFEGTLGDAKTLKQALKAVMISDSDFQQEFSNARVSNAGLARYYLQALEAAHANEAEPWYLENDDPSVMTLEHILPQNANGAWEGIDPDHQKLLVRRLGNLCIMNKSGNEALANKSFAQKRGSLSEAAYSLTAMIAGYEKWGPDEIADRQLKLAELAVRAWPI